jgi:hypothetical protein
MTSALSSILTRCAEEAGSVGALALEVGVSRTVLHDLIRGRRCKDGTLAAPSLATTKALLAYLEITLDELEDLIASPDESPPPGRRCPVKIDDRQLTLGGVW